ncbi:hypothetical protein BJ742DRAFT_780047 [Cladochytrium replicatum]|nr:hypothetical protein BJ742DRAFT_780047 [Cladochytrium replicatum]
MVLLVYWLPYYLAPQKSELALPHPRPPLFRSIDSSKDIGSRPSDLRDVQLGKIGWIRMATRPLTPDELADFGPHSSSPRDVPKAPPAAEASSDVPAHPGNNLALGNSPPAPIAQPAFAAPNAPAPTLRGRVLSATVSAAFSTASIATTLASRFIPQSLGVAQRRGLSIPSDTPAESTSPPASPTDAPTEPLPKPYRDVYGVLKQKTLLLYESDDERECTDVLLLPQYRVDLFPENLPDNEVYARENPVRIRSKVLLDLQKGRRKRNGSTGEASGAEGSPGLEFSTQRMLTMYAYAPTGCDKEDWYLMLRRSSRLRTRHGSGAGTETGSNSSGSGVTGRVESMAMKNYRRIMQKLVERVKGDGEAEGESGEKKPGTIPSTASGSPQSMSAESYSATAWLNALVGRAFVAIHSNPRIKEWLLAKLSRRTKHGVPAVSSFKDGVSSAKGWFSRLGSPIALDPKQQQQQQQQFGFLGDIVIQDIDVGDSIPLLSNPKLLDLSVDGDMRIEMDIEYTGGARVQAATLATISVPSLDRYGVKPLQVPLVVAIRVKRFAARVLLKVKPYWETNRVWVGFYRDPGIQLELDVEPIISNKLIKLHLVNQVIERRVIDALEEFVMLPNMDDWSFWPLPEGKGGIFWGDDPVEDDEDGTEDAITDGEDCVGLDDVNRWLRRHMGRIPEETRSEIDELGDERARINGIVSGMYHTPPRTPISSSVTGTIVQGSATTSSRSRSTTAETPRDEPIVRGASRSRYEYDMGETVVDLTKVGELSKHSGSWVKGEDGEDGELTPVARRKRPGVPEPKVAPSATVNEAVKKLVRRPSSEIVDSERSRSIEEWVRNRNGSSGDPDPADDENSDGGSVYYRDDVDNDEGVEADDEGGEEREGEQSPVTPGELNAGGSSSLPSAEPASETTTPTASPAHTWSSRALQILSSPRTRDATSTVARTAGYLAARAMTSTVSLLEVAGVVVPINDEQVQMNNSLFTKQREPSGISVVSSTCAAPSAAGDGAQRDDIATAAAGAAAAAANELLDFAIERVGGGLGEGSRSAPSTPKPTLSAAAAALTPNRSLPHRASFPRLRGDRPLSMYNNLHTPGVHPTRRESVPTPFRRDGASPPQAGPQAWKTRFPSSPAAAPSSSATASGARPPSTVLDMLGVSISTSLPPGSGTGCDETAAAGSGQLRRRKGTGASTYSRTDLRESWHAAPGEQNDGAGGMGSAETI